MSLRDQIHWHEGLFVQPHHFQLIQKSIGDTFIAERALHDPYPYGLLKCEIDSEKLARENVISFDELQMFMPSGLYLEHNMNTYVPPLDLKEYFEDGAREVLISIAVPRWAPKQPNLVSDMVPSEKNARLYVVGSKTVTDENTGENPKNLLVRKINTILLVNDATYPDFEILPIAKVVKNLEKSGRMLVDPKYIPPCVRLSGSHILYGIVENILAEVLTHAKEYCITLHALKEFSTGTPKLIRASVKLLIISQFTTSFETLLSHYNPSPLVLYDKLKSFIVSLGSIIPGFDLWKLPPYSHNNPAPLFWEFKTIITELLCTKLFRSNAVSLPFVRKDDFFCLEIADDILDRPGRTFLCVNTKMKPETLIQEVENGTHFKLLVKSKLRKMAIAGVSLRYQCTLPDDVFCKEDEFYFAVSQTDKRWTEIVNEKQMVVFERIEDKDFPIQDIRLITLFEHIN